MISLYDTRWRNFNKLAKFTKFVKIARVQRVKYQMTLSFYSTKTPKFTKAPKIFPGTKNVDIKSLAS
jgi:hypothetical protein